MSGENNIEISFKDIAPYSEKEIHAALQFLKGSPDFKDGLRYFYPDYSDALIERKLEKCNSCADFQVTFIEPIISNLIKKSINTFKITGLDVINKKDSHLYLSNHRDIFLDSGLLQYSLYHHGYDFTEISLGDNLIVNPLIERVAKLNNMYTVFRKGNKLEKLDNAKNLSAYLRYALTQKKVSAWIAHGNGRAKDGNDQTFPGLIRMLMMSGTSDYKKSLSELNIVVESVSYQYEPCVLEKAVECHIKETTGSYTKYKGENVEHILKGIEQYKGNVSLHLEKLNVEYIDFCGTPKEIIANITAEIDRVVYSNYQLYNTNYMALDVLENTNKYSAFYTETDLNSFKTYLKKLTEENHLQKRILQLYAQPVLNKEKC
ncbi:MAG: hypothetical protein CR985_01560 [Flavobacteriales bacterium]|nr:MAG: hypothetical protein CR985_01560 [Flavobacteriales bacterium]